MASANVIEITTSNFSEKVLKSSGTVLVDFWAEWCGPCKQLAPMLDEVANQNVGKVTIGKVNVDHNGELASQFHISAIPTLIIFKEGRPVEQVVGLVSKKDLEKKLGLVA